MDLNKESSKLQHMLLNSHIPDHMHDGVFHYVINGRPTGSFLYAVLTNNLKEACNKADEINKHLLYDYVYFLYNYAPMGCWGSEESVDHWMEIGGLRGLVGSAKAV